MQIKQTQTTRHAIFIYASVAALALAACSAAAPTATAVPAATNAPAPTAVVAMAEPTTDAMAKPADSMTSTDAMTKTEAIVMTEVMTEAMTSTEAMQDKPAEGQAMTDTALRPAWQQVQLTDARTGKAFTLADFAGKTVYVEPFATWCSNCRAQLNNVRTAKDQLDDQHVFVALSVETNLTTEDIAKYSEAQGFDWVFAVMTPELLKQLTDQFGLTIANPPSTPHFIIRADGTTTDLSTGIKSVEDLVATIQAERK